MIKRLILFFTTSLLVLSNIPAQTIPTSYEAAKEIGDAKYKALLKANTPAEVRYVVLNKEQELNKLLAYENTIYVVDRTYDLKGKNLSVPKNSVIVFRNGNIENGTLQGEDAKYSFARNKKQGCRLAGQWEKIAPIYTASELGLKANSQSAKDFNYSKLQVIVKNRLNVYFDGTYYVSFPKPLLLDYQIHLYGGKLLFSRYAFDVTNGGGIYANGVHFNSIREGIVDDIVCGTREKHSAIITSPLTFLNCHFSCNRVVSLEFKHTNPLETQFGIPRLTVTNCRADRTAKFLALDAVIQDGAKFKNNIWEGFNSAPIYLTTSHSKRAAPDEENANPWAEEIFVASGDVVIDSNVFKGKEVTDNSYYCAALVISKRCFFTNNYLKDIINISDKKREGYTAYDAYLSCVEVTYKRNYIEDMMSYSKNGAKKPQCELGKSKGNPLSIFGYKARREYTDNVFLSDGKRFIGEGADKESIFANIFNNVAAIDEYIWERNSIIYRNIRINGRSSSGRYGSFSFKDNYIESESLTGNLIFPNSEFNLDAVTITGNTFNIANGKMFTLFNQLYKEEHSRYRHGTLDISDNRFTKAAPVYYFFSVDSVRVKNNRIENASLDGMTYLSNYTGKMLTAPVSVCKLDAEFVLDTKGTSKGGARQMFSSTCKGKYSMSMKKVPEKGVEYHYVVGANQTFHITLVHGKSRDSVEFIVRGGRVTYSHGTDSGRVVFGETKPITWSASNGVVFKSSFKKGSPNRIVTSLNGQGLSDLTFDFKAE